MTENLEKAKQMFFDYCCSPYFMARDGADSEYKSYGATEELEAEWRKEYIASWVSRLSLDDFHALSQLNHAWGVEALPDLIKMCNQAEGYAKLEYADVIWQLAKPSKLDPSIRQQATETSKSAWETLAQGNFAIPEQFQTKIKLTMARSDTTTPEQYVVRRAQKALEEARKKI